MPTSREEDRTYSLRAYPLTWPDGWRRTDALRRTRAAFGKSVQRADASWRSKEALSIAEATARVLTELNRMGVNENNVVLSTNLKLRLDGYPRSDQANPADPGAAVYWRKTDKSPMKCMAIDRYDRVEGNLAAIAATLEAMRAIERHGGAEIMERTFQGFAALPAKASSTWKAQLELDPQRDYTEAEIETQFRKLANQHHPDKGGDPARFREVTEARAAARQELAS
jgi:hypothetical protein